MFLVPLPYKLYGFFCLSKGRARPFLAVGQKRPSSVHPSAVLATVGVSTALGWTQAARCGLACLLYARQYFNVLVHMEKSSDPSPNYRIHGGNGK